MVFEATNMEVSDMKDLMELPSKYEALLMTIFVENVNLRRQVDILKGGCGRPSRSMALLYPHPCWRQ